MLACRVTWPMTEAISMPAEWKPSPRVCRHLQGTPWGWHLRWYHYVQLPFSKTLRSLQQKTVEKIYPSNHFSISSHWKRKHGYCSQCLFIFSLLFIDLLPFILIPFSHSFSSIGNDSNVWIYVYVHANYVYYWVIFDLHVSQVGL